MISDEELKEFLAWKFDPNSHESAFQEMAQELLAYREAERAIWQNAPEWANWFARDLYGAARFYEDKPYPWSSVWLSKKLSLLVDDVNWQSALQERPK